MSEQLPSLSCSHTNVTLKEAMTSINFTDEESVRHLRIPKKNEVPEDTVLASGYKSKLLQGNKINVHISDVCNIFLTGQTYKFQYFGFKIIQLQLNSNMCADL